MMNSTHYKQLTVILIRPSKYDDEGYIVQHFRGTQPSNTLSCLYSLTEDAIQQDRFAGVKIKVEALDEIVTRVDPKQLGRKFNRPGTKTVVALVGVQTNQYPRAQDLARQFKAEGFEVMIGGFHVSGAIAMSDTMPPECTEMLEAGVTLVLGEVEDRWTELLVDVLHDRLQPLYNFLSDKPDLYDKPLPKTFAKTQKKFVLRQTATIDAGRGCPFNCSFCTIINVQGRKMRYRSSEHILNQIRKNYFLKGKRKGIRHYFFTDDNFSRNPCWEEIFDGLIQLREREGKTIDFMMQIDTLAARLPHFVEKAARAGCVQVFIGMESIREDNLKAAGKKQNRIAEYKEMIAKWHEAGVVCHVGYIIGFPNDTYERVMDDIRTLREDLLVDQASFFMLTPLPGSEDHRRAVRDGVPMDADYNNFDSFHATAPHPNMTAEEWTRVYRDAWSTFYSYSYMRQSLLRQNPHTYWATLKNLIWYRASMIEGAHPMITGFIRRKYRQGRRPVFPLESRWAFFKRRLHENAYIFWGYYKLYFEMQNLWLETRIRREEYAFLGDLRKLASASMQEAKMNWAQVHTVLEERLGAVRESVGSRALIFGNSTYERIGAVRDALGSRATDLGASVGERVDIMRDRLESSLQTAGKSFSKRTQALQTGFSDLKFKYLPPMKRPTWFRRAIQKLNVFSVPKLESREKLSDYWKRTGEAIRKFQFWRLNPFSLCWNLARDTRYALVFLIFLKAERY